MQKVSDIHNTPPAQPCCLKAVSFISEDACNENRRCGGHLLHVSETGNKPTVLYSQINPSQLFRGQILVIHKGTLKAAIYKIGRHSRDTVPFNKHEINKIFIGKELIYHQTQTLRHDT